MADACFVIQNGDGAYRTASGAWSNDRDDAYVVVTNDRGTASFGKLGAGTYKLVETKAPDGYDLIADSIAVDLVITNVGSTSHTLTATVKGDNANVVAVDAGAGIATIQIKNSKSKSSYEGGKSISNGGTGAGASSGDKNGSADSQRSSLLRSLASRLPITADPTLPACGILFAVATAFIVVGVGWRHARGAGRK